MPDTLQVLVSQLCCMLAHDTAEGSALATVLTLCGAKSARLTLAAKHVALLSARPAGRSQSAVCSDLWRAVFRCHKVDVVAGALILKLQHPVGQL